MPIVFDSEAIEILSIAYRHELHNCYSYQKIANWLNVLGFENLSKYWDDWSKEEFNHAQIVKEFCDDNNLTIDMSIPVEQPSFILEGISFVDATLETEIKTDELYNEMYNYALDTKNGFLIDFSLGFLKEQREEIAKALTIKDKIKNIGNNLALLQLFDNTFES